MDQFLEDRPLVDLNIDYLNGAIMAYEDSADLIDTLIKKLPKTGLWLGDSLQVIANSYKQKAQIMKDLISLINSNNNTVQ